MALNIEMGESLVRSGNVREGLGALRTQNQPEKTGDPSFLNQLKSAIGEVDQMQKTSDVASLDVATGHEKSIHEAMIMMEKADIALRTMVSVRNKVIEAYREIMRMQV